MELELKFSTFEEASKACDKLDAPVSVEVTGVGRWRFFPNGHCYKLSDGQPPMCGYCHTRHYGYQDHYGA